ncbi:rho guanine nucleotide exchange factor 37 isoform X3 [Tachysurus vachellii]|nr:rho guanine nucleotide exchange factor 37 isoform X3 [Tachysurus vachellii]XP_060741456.1 rho guanine nucleotide exchange factor 37 isoform X3 [Tachysurus vachellii]XP_060741457.1 rho guanine nucleotide exchange factor 37 isoform X3 [Tachysurus vachellii]XP_060741458.1 rho guanine nucleotide exchange factor 37 isoform X3 [Tachysurus vachellii]XP_060741459.1 rho guanine nucleotide exchange factor 37 isoform X3 [Tachysurus vachellii]
MSRSGMERRLGRLSRQGTSEELPELKEVAEEVRSQIPVVTVEDVDGDVENKEENDGKRKTKEEEAAERERKAQRQSMTIQELVDTERNYLKSLQICTVTIRNNLEKLQPPLDNLDGMFQHIDKVMDVSGRLLSLLDKAQVKPSDPQFLETLCASFLQMTEDIEMAYKEYLANYNNITAIEAGYKQKEVQWMEMVKVIKSSAPDVNASTLSFFLVMPVQRIARYPLLLQTIQKHTDPQHPAYSLLEHTAQVTVQLNCRINEYKRFREVADKYKKTETLTIKDKINRLSGHSIAKKTARLSQYIKHETGIVPKVKDEEFDALVGFFFILEKCVTDLHANMATYLSHLQRFLSCRPEEADLDLEGEKAALFSKEITVALRQWIFPVYEARLKTLVFKPLSSLHELMAGPRNLIRKRRDKLLDFETIEEKSSLSYDEQAIANTYKTINTLLLNELPQFNAKSLQLLWATLGAFSCLQKDLAMDMEQLATSFTHQLPHTYMDNSAFWEWAESSVLEGARKLEKLCQSVQDELNAPIVKPVVAVSEKCLKGLMEKYGAEKLYQLTGPVVATRDLDLNLNKGELVAVISEMDTRGDRRRWLVDAGGPRGYVPASKLTHYNHVSLAQPPPSPLLSATSNGPGARRHSYTPGMQPIITRTAPCFQVFAGYDFTARSSHELSLRSGEPVRVVEPHDKRGNAEWSLVEARGQRGYVPTNYLAVLPSVVASPTLPYH